MNITLWSSASLLPYISHIAHMYDGKTCDEDLECLTCTKVRVTGHCNGNSVAHVQGGRQLGVCRQTTSLILCGSRVTTMILESNCSLTLKFVKLFLINSNAAFVCEQCLTWL